MERASSRLSSASYPSLVLPRFSPEEGPLSRVPRSRPKSGYQPTSVTSLPPLTDRVSTRSKKWKGSVLSRVKPLNEPGEKRRFMQDFSYSPQFVYKRALPSFVRERYDRPSMELLPLAVGIIRNVLKKYGSYELHEEKNGGRVLSDGECLVAARKYLREQGISNVRVVVSRGIVPFAHMTHDKRGSNVLEIKSGVIREHRIQGLLNHEIGTHYLRARNDKLQPWGSKSGKRLHKLRNKNPTEEGLASLHSILLQPKGPYLFRSALLYYAACMAHQLSFSELFHDLGQFVGSPDSRWNYCMRVKRGVMDASKPGCFCKDQVYLIGALQLLKHRHSIDFSALYLGKLAWEDVDRLKPLARKSKVIVPAFLRSEENYLSKLDAILRVNRISNEMLAELDL